jgi:hypothetical protein
VLPNDAPRRRPDLPERRSSARQNESASFGRRSSFRALGGRIYRSTQRLKLKKAGRLAMKIAKRELRREAGASMRQPPMLATTARIVGEIE